ncbi:hypothetical protein Tco_0102937 [Tanacetum coccineum]
MAERIYSLRLENLKVHAMLDIERDRVNNLRLHISLSHEEFCQIRRDRDDTRGRLRRLESYVERRLVLSYDESKSKRVYERAFMTLFGQDNETFTSMMFLYVDQLQHQLDKDEFQEDKSMAAFWVLNNQFQKFIDWNSQEEQYGSSVMAHNHYLEEARKKTQERNRNSGPSVMHTTSLQNTANGSKPNPMSNNQISRSLPVSKSSRGMSNGVSLVDHSRNSSSFSDSKHFVCSTCHKCVFNANHDNCITKFLKEVDSHAKIAIGQRFSPKKSSAVHEKPNTPRSCLRWKPTGRIFKIAGLRWIPTGKMFTDNTTKVDSEPPNGSNGDINNPYECDQTLMSVQASLFNDKMMSVHISSSLALQRHIASADNTTGPVPQSKESPGPAPNLFMPGPISSRLVPNLAPAIPYVPPTNKELELLFQPMFDEYFTPPGDRQVPTINAVQVSVNLTGPSVSISCDQDAPSGSHLTSSSDHQSSSVHHGVAAEQSFKVNPFSAADPEPFVNVFAPDSNSEASSSGVITTTEPLSTDIH